MHQDANLIGQETVIHEGWRCLALAWRTPGAALGLQLSAQRDGQAPVSLGWTGWSSSLEDLASQAQRAGTRSRPDGLPDELPTQAVRQLLERLRAQLS